MNKERLFKKYEKKYKDYLYGDCSYEDVFNILDKINSTKSIFYDVKKSGDSIENIVHYNTTRANKIEEKVREKYETEIVKPLTEELLDLLQFKGLVKGAQYKKKAEELKKKLKKYDGVFTIRHRALMRFFNSKMGSKYGMVERLFIVLALGALDTKNI